MAFVWRLVDWLYYYWTSPQSRRVHTTQWVRHRVVSSRLAEGDLRIAMIFWATVDAIWTAQNCKKLTVQWVQFIARRLWFFSSLFCFIYRYDQTAWCRFGSWNILTCTCLARAAEIRASNVFFFFAHSFIPLLLSHLTWVAFHLNL